MSTAQNSWECLCNWCGSGVVVRTAKLAGKGCSFGDESEVRDGGLPQLCAGDDG